MSGSENHEVHPGATGGDVDDRALMTDAADTELTDGESAYNRSQAKFTNLSQIDMGESILLK
jgi:hypothetical protein